MSFRTPLPAKKVLGFTIVNYTFRAVLNVFFMSLLLAGFGVLLTLALAVFALVMKVRDAAVRREIEEGRHDPAWGNHVRRQSQREADALLERHPLTRPLFLLACVLGIHKKQ